MLDPPNGLQKKQAIYFFNFVLSKKNPNTGFGQLIISADTKFSPCLLVWTQLKLTQLLVGMLQFSLNVTCPLVWLCVSSILMVCCCPVLSSAYAQLLMQVEITMTSFCSLMSYIDMYFFQIHDILTLSRNKVLLIDRKEVLNLTVDSLALLCTHATIVEFPVTTGLVSTNT